MPPIRRSSGPVASGCSCGHHHGPHGVGPWAPLEPSEVTTGAMYAGRWLAGRRLDGAPRRPGQMPSWQHALCRLGAQSGVLGSGALVVVGHPGEAVALAGVTSAGLLWAATHSVAMALRGWRHQRERVRPLAAVLRPMLGWHGVPPSQWMDVPLRYDSPRDEPIPVQIWFPIELEITADLQRRVMQAVATRLQIARPLGRWELSGASPSVTVTRRPIPPSSVQWADVLELVSKTKESAPLLGIQAGGKAFHVDLDSESPHILISAGTGGGKSILAQLIMMQVLAHGGRVIILDVKLASQMWAYGVPGVAVLTDPETIFNSLRFAAEEINRRNQMVVEARDLTVVNSLPRILIVVEEMASLTEKLTQWWAAVRTKDQPRPCPALAWLREILSMGRSTHVHVVSLTQHATVAAFGGSTANASTARSQFGLIAISRTRAAGWKMLAPEATPLPYSRIRGRFGFVFAGETIEAQVPYVTESDAREWIAAGQDRLGLDLPSDSAAAVLESSRLPIAAGARPLRLVKGEIVTPPPPQTHTISTRAAFMSLHQRPDLRVLAAQTPDPTGPDPIEARSDPAPGISLSAAIEPGGPLEGMSIHAVRKASQRPGFPPQVGRDGPAALYAPERLSEWRANRRRPTA